MINTTGTVAPTDFRSIFALTALGGTTAGAAVVAASAISPPAAALVVQATGEAVGAGTKAAVDLALANPIVAASLLVSAAAVGAVYYFVPEPVTRGVASIQDAWNWAFGSAETPDTKQIAA